MRVALLTLLTGLLGASEAQAAAFEAKTSRYPLSNREVERSLKMSRGWLEFSLGADVKDAVGYWSPEGEAVEFTSARWLYTTERFAARYGLSTAAELYFYLPYHYMRLTNEDLGTDIADQGVGDPRFGLIYEVLDRQDPMTSVVVQVDYKGPLGKETPGSYAGGPYMVTGFVMSTGTPDLTAALAAKQQLGPFALLGRVGYDYRFGAVVQYVLETEMSQFSGRLKPGDILFAEGGLMIQAGPIALDGQAVFQRRGKTLVGMGSDDFLGISKLDAIPESDGWSMDVQSHVTANMGRAADLQLGFLVPIRGEDLQFFPIEDIHPTRGFTYSATFKFRY